LSLILAGSHYFIVIRAIRLIRVFRVLKLTRYLGEAVVLKTALIASRPKITVFLLSVFTLVLIVGTLMYLVEGPENGYTSIPKSMYWAIVTLTTVGYGDITPQTTLGQALSAMVMILGYGIIAVPTGIVSVELSKAHDLMASTQACPNCGRGGHDIDARHCKFCGSAL
jgi:voltage-gated potassium channel